jgi:hypothetical protein
MKKATVRQILFCICLFLQSALFGQSIEDYIHENAIEVSNLTKLEDSIYKKFSHYKITLVGEFHGTNESAQFVNSLTNLLTENNETVLLGLEIPNDKLKNFNQKPTLENLINSDFFTDSSVDGRNSKSWFDLIARQLQNKKVRLFFFDETELQSKLQIDRDSIMYLNVKSEMQKFPNAKTILLSGNIHNKLKPYKNITKLGRHLLLDRELNLTNKLRSINISYEKGRMFNNVGQGLQTRELANNDSPFAKANSLKNYLLFFPNNYDYDYNCILFCRKLTASKSFDLSED